VSAVERPRYRIFVSATSDGLTDHRPHGDGLVAFALLRELASRGHEIHVAGTQIDVREPLPDNVYFHALPLRRSETLVERIAYAIAVRRLYDRLARAERFDIVHQMNPVIAGLSLGFALNAPPLVLGAYIANWADDDCGPSRTSLAKRLVGIGRAIVASAQQVFAAAIIVTTRSARDRVPLARFLATKMTVIPHGIDLDRLAPLEPNAVADDTAPAVLFLANLTRRKGLFTLLEAFEIVAQRVPNARLLIAGGGEDAKAEVEAFVARRTWYDRVTLLGNVPRTGIANAMRHATIYCLPSHGEPFGMTAIEAMACGVPVVVTQDAGLGEIVPHDAGARVPSRDPAALAEAIVALIEVGGSVRARIGARNRAYAERHFGLPRVADRLEGVYGLVVAKRERAAMGSPERVAVGNA